MYVSSNSVTQDTYSISNIQKITFTNGNMNVASSTGSSTYDLDDVRYVSFIDYTVGIVAFEKNNKILLFPNPVEDQFNIRINSSNAQSCTIEIYSIDGRLIHSEKTALSSDNHAINVSGYASGIYLCKINNGYQISSTKFVKQ
jgi:hypothetical protein